MKNKSKFSEADINKMKSMRVEGKTYLEISAFFGCSPSNIAYWVDNEFRERTKFHLRKVAKIRDSTDEAKRKHNEFMKSDAGRNCVAKSWIRCYLNNKSLSKDDVLDVLREFE